MTDLAHLRRGVTAAALAGAMLTGGAAAAETLRLAHFVAPAHVITGSLIEPLAEGVAADSGGALTIQVYPGGELGAGPQEQYVRALQGVADIVWGLQGYTSSQFPRTMIAEMPGAIPQGMSGHEFLWNGYEAHLAQEFPGTRPLALWTSEPNVFIMRDREVRRPEDVAGLKIRVSGNISGALVEALGATPVQMPAGEMYNALQTGLIDGIITGASAIADFKLNEVANSYSVGAPLGNITFYLVMNEARYQGLSDELKAVIDANSGRALSKSAEDGWNARAEETLEALRADPAKTVVDLSDEEIAAFDAVLSPLTETLVAQVPGGAEALAAMRGE
ncbi:TRAP transporter substrate-binding protein [Plastorhodobacter daqingensis]|uniref:TRAP transporter substrate-binding protein n=1 Tax=Plastorhodobacter daqingensis TaxID=1387281 RepID=A0ABW2ULQ7_9RHOB